MDSDVPVVAQAPRKRTGGRSARVRQAVLAATMEQVTAYGIEGLTISDIAKRAGVAETTVYRRWGTRTAVIADAVENLVANDAIPDTGTLRGDLEVLANQIARLITQPGIARLLGTTVALSVDPEIDAARQSFWRDRFEQSAPIVARAIVRGELPDTVRPRDVLETLSAPMYFRILVGDAPIDDEFIARCVGNTLTMCAAGR